MRLERPPHPLRGPAILRHNDRTVPTDTPMPVVASFVWTIRCPKIPSEESNMIFYVCSLSSRCRAAAGPLARPDTGNTNWKCQGARTSTGRCSLAKKAETFLGSHFPARLSRSRASNCPVFCLAPPEHPGCPLPIAPSFCSRTHSLYRGYARRRLRRDATEAGGRSAKITSASASEPTGIGWSSRHRHNPSNISSTPQKIGADSSVAWPFKTGPSALS